MAEHPNRKSIRAANFNYASAGAYFLTICLHDRETRFGHVRENGVVWRTSAGVMVEHAMLGIARQFSDAIVDEHIVMPDHVHLIIFVGVDPLREHVSNVVSIVQWFKTVTTKRYGVGVRTEGWLPYDGHLWQRSFHDRILRTDQDIENARMYIAGNPARWLQRLPDVGED